MSKTLDKWIEDRRDDERQQRDARPVGNTKISHECHAAMLDLIEAQAKALGTLGTDEIGAWYVYGQTEMDNARYEIDALLAHMGLE